MKKKHKSGTPLKTPRIRPVLRETELDRGLIKAWMKTVFSLAKLPGGTAAAKDNPEPVLTKIIRRELAAIKELWEVFNLERDLINKRLLGTRQQTVAYLLGFHLPNAARMALLWRNFADRYPSWKKTFNTYDLSINDIGCGTGALAQSLVSELLGEGVAPKNLEINLSDVASGPLEAAEHVLNNMSPDLVVKRHCVPVEKLRGDRFTAASKGAAKSAHKDTAKSSAKSELAGGGESGREPLFIYTLGYVWNELRKNRAAQKNLETILTSHATRKELAIIFLVEPAAELQSRDAMELRDQLVAGGLAAIYPCPALNKCPMLDRPKDWCFTEGRWKRPAHAEIIDRSLGIDRAWLGASLYAFATPRLLDALQSPAGTTSAAAKGTAPLLASAKHGVVVGRPQTVATTAGNPGRFEYLLCTVAGLKKSPPPLGAKAMARGEITKA